MSIDNIIDISRGKVSISHNPRFSEVWENFSSKYNKLSKKLELANIDMELLIDVIEATKELEYLGYIESYKIGLRDAK